MLFMRLKHQFSTFKPSDTVDHCAMEFFAVVIDNHDTHDSGLLLNMASFHWHLRYLSLSRCFSVQLLALKVNSNSSGRL